MAKYNMANVFNIFTRSDGNMVYNLSKSIYINSSNAAKLYYSEYTIVEGDSWTLISHKEFGTIELWWLICKFNQINSPIDLPVPGEILKIPTDTIVEQIINGL